MATGAILGLVGAGLTAAAGIGSSIMTNRSNKQMVSSSNAFNMRMMEKQMAYNDKVTDPSYIRGRLENAGYNPNVLANASTLGSAQGISAPQAAQMPADYSGVGNSIASAMSVLSQYQSVQADKELKSAQADQIFIDNQTRAVKNLAELSEIQERAGNERAKRQISEIMARWQDNLNMADYQNVMSNTRKIREETQALCIQNAMSNIDLQNYPQEVKLRIGQAAANLRIAVLTGNLTEKQVRHEALKMAETIVRTDLTKEQYNTQQQTTQSGIIQNAKSRVTFDTEVKLVKESLIKAYNTSGPDNMFQTAYGAIRHPLRVLGVVD